MDYVVLAKKHKNILAVCGLRGLVVLECWPFAWFAPITQLCSISTFLELKKILNFHGDKEALAVSSTSCCDCYEIQSCVFIIHLGFYFFLLICLKCDSEHIVSGM